MTLFVMSLPVESVSIKLISQVDLVDQTTTVTNVTIISNIYHKPMHQGGNIRIQRYLSN